LGIRLIPLREELLARERGDHGWMVMATSAFLFLVACVSAPPEATFSVELAT
jgi:hypothetical protein